MNVQTRLPTYEIQTYTFADQRPLRFLEIVILRAALRCYIKTLTLGSAESRAADRLLYKLV